MTLIELTVALVVAGMVVSFGYAAFATVIDRREQTERAAVVNARGIGVRRMLLRWLDGATPEISTGGTDPDAYNQLRFTTRAATPMHSAETGVTLFIDDGRDGLPPGLVAILQPDVGNDSLRVLIDSTARDMSIEYLTQTSGVRQWRTPETIAESERPLVTRLTITSTSPDMASAYAMPIDAPTSISR